MIARFPPAARGHLLHSLPGVVCLVVAATVACLTTARGAEPVPPIDLVRQAKRIVFLGDSITADGRWVAFLDAWMQAAGITADVIDCGLSSETVSGLSEEGHADGKFPRPTVS